jgi:hypothetical protein
MSQFSAPIVIPGNVSVTGTAAVAGLSAPAGCIADTNVATPATGAAGISTYKQNHRERHRQVQAAGSAIVSQTTPACIVNGTDGLVISFKASVKTACVGGATVTFDLKKNGTSVLSAAISFSSSDSAGAVKTATISTASCVAGDLFEIVTTATAGGGTVGQESYAEALIDEYPT